MLLLKSCFAEIEYGFRALYSSCLHLEIVFGDYSEKGEEWSPLRRENTVD